jgi:hypothetical protein
MYNFFSGHQIVLLTLSLLDNLEFFLDLSLLSYQVVSIFVFSFVIYIEVFSVDDLL